MKKVLLLSLLLILLTGCSNSDKTIDGQEIDLDENDLNEQVESEVTEPQVSELPVQDSPRNPQVNLPDLLENSVSPDSNIELEQQLALVDSVEVLILESFPPQYNAVVTGNYRNGCEAKGEVTQLVTENRIEIALGVQAFGEICTMALVPFKESISIDTTNLTSGTYALTVNGITTQFDVQ